MNETAEKHDRIRSMKGGRISPYGPLNEYTSRIMKEAEENEP